MATIGTVTPDNLVNSNKKIVSKSITLITGQNLTRGALLGLIKIAAGTATADAGNTGNGTVTALALAAGGLAKIGSWILTCISAVTNGGIFKLVDPDGLLIADDITIVAGAGGTIIFTGAGITFTITDGATDFAADDFFTITVIAGSLKYNKSLAAALDGSEEPDSVLAEDKDASAADKTTVAFKQGEFNSRAMTFGTGHTAASVYEGLRNKGVIINTASPA